jgi:calcineurin-like phosphoesterase family protein
MNEAIIERSNAIVKPNDNLWVLGDFSLSKGAVRDYLPRLNGRKRLVMGNHDWCFPTHRGHEKMLYKYLEWGFEAVLMYYEIQWASPVTGKTYNVAMSHLPYAPPPLNWLQRGWKKTLGVPLHDTRYLEYRPERNSRVNLLLCGHVHQHWQRMEGMINVGVDVWDYAPISWGQICNKYSL